MSNIKFVNARYRFEIEIQNEACKGNNKLDELVITSQKTGYTRFHSEQLKEMLE